MTSRNYNKLGHSLPWDEVEKQIYKEKNWLQNVIDLSLVSKEDAPVDFGKDSLFREIAISIISGKFAAREISRSPALSSFWYKARKDGRRLKRPKMRHGQEWHRDTMQKIEDYFVYSGYEVDREPNLYWGRADLGVYKGGEKDLFVEVGTTSLFKLWINLEVMENFDYLIVPSDSRLIEFLVPPHKMSAVDKKLGKLF